MMALDNDSSYEKSIEKKLEEENYVPVIDEDEVDKSELLLLDRSEEKLSETQRKFSGKVKVSFSWCKIISLQCIKFSFKNRLKKL